MVTVYHIRPEKQEVILKKMKELGIFEKDIEEQFIRGSGKGGQKRNKTNNMVFLKHIPTGIMVRYGKYRERNINQILARRLLCEKMEKENHS